MEELETPVNFADFHAYMTMSSVEVDAAYEKEIEEHVSDSVLANTKMRSLLLGKGKGAFVPNGKWEGLKGLEPLWPEGQQGLELTWREELVDQLRSKIKARPINPKLYAACKEEFERLKQYIYIDSSSEVSSPLVVAPKATAPYFRFCGDYVQVNKKISCPHGAKFNVRDKITQISGYSYFGEFDMKNAFHLVKYGSCDGCLTKYLWCHMACVRDGE